MRIDNYPDLLAIVYKNLEKKTSNCLCIIFVPVRFTTKRITEIGLAIKKLVSLKFYTYLLQLQLLLIFFLQKHDKRMEFLQQTIQILKMDL